MSHPASQPDNLCGMSAELGYSWRWEGESLQMGWILRVRGKLDHAYRGVNSA